MFHIDVQNMGSTAIVRCIGKLLRGEAAGKVRDALESATDTQTILLDLSAVEAIDAGGVNTLVWLRHWAMSRSITLKLVDPSSFVSEILVRFRLEGVFEISSARDAIVILAHPESWERTAACWQTSTVQP